MLLWLRSHKLLAPTGILALWGLLLALALLPGAGVLASRESTVQLGAAAPQPLPLTWLPSRTQGFNHTSQAVHALVEYGGRLYAGVVASTTHPALIWAFDEQSEWAPSSEPGFGGPNSGVHAMAVFGNVLYAGTSNPNGGQVWSSGGGGWSHVADNGFDSPANSSIRALAGFKGQLYAGTSNAEGAQVWAYDGQHWTPVVVGGLGDRNNVAVEALSVHGNHLYAGARNANGAQIWSTVDGNSWNPAVSDGLYNRSNTAVLALGSYHGQLYAAVENSSGQGGEIWYYDGIVWRASVRDGFSGASHPLDIHNAAVASLAVHDDVLYAGTINDVFGTQIWFTDGSGWWPSTRTGLGAGENNRAAGALASYQGALWAGMENVVDGAAVWYGSPRLEFTVESKPRVVAPPYRIRYQTRITNTLSTTLTMLQAFDTWESLGNCVYDRGERTHLRWDIGDLAPGESRLHEFTLETHTWCQPQIVTNTVRLQGSNLAPMFAFAKTIITSAPPPTASPTPGPGGPFTATLRQGSHGYTGTLDTYLSQSNPTRRYCDETRIRVGDSQQLAGLIRFDLSIIPSTADVFSASLRLYGLDWAQGRDISIGLYAISRTVDVCETTWNESRAGEQWAVAGCKDMHADRRPNPEVTFTTSGLRQWYNLDVTEAVRGWADESLPNNGLLLLGLPADSEIHAFASAGHAEPALRPMLVVTYFMPPAPTSTPTSTPTETATPTPTASPPGSLTLTGLVYDAELGPTQPISAAAVSALMCVPARFQTFSGADGTYSLYLPDLYLAGCDEITLEVWADGYESWSETVAVAELRANPERDFVLIRRSADTPTPTQTPTSTSTSTSTSTPTGTATPTATTTPTRWYVYLPVMWTNDE
jgi:hypothetical protein